MRLRNRPRKTHLTKNKIKNNSKHLPKLKSFARKNDMKMNKIQITKIIFKILFSLIKEKVKKLIVIGKTYIRKAYFYFLTPKKMPSYIPIKTVYFQGGRYRLGHDISNHIYKWLRYDCEDTVSYRYEIPLTKQGVKRGDLFVIIKDYVLGLEDAKGKILCFLCNGFHGGWSFFTDGEDGYLIETDHVFGFKKTLYKKPK